VACVSRPREDFIHLLPEEGCRCPELSSLRRPTRTLSTAAEICIRTLRLKVKPEAYPWLKLAATEVNQVWNFANATSEKAGRPFSGSPVTRGSELDGRVLHGGFGRGLVPTPARSPAPKRGECDGTHDRESTPRRISGLRRGARRPSRSGQGRGRPSTPRSSHTVENPMLFMYQSPKFDAPLAAGDHWKPCLYMEVFWKL
jgi:hypothetical protein